MANEKQATVTIGDYLVAKNGTTKYLKLQTSPKADAATKKLVEDLKALLGGDVIFVNLMDPEFKEKHNIPDFVKGRISVPVASAAAAAAPAKRKQDDDDGVNF